MDPALRQSFEEDGAVLMKNCLDDNQVALCREAFDWAVENHGPNASMMFQGTEQSSHVDNANPLAKERLDELVTNLPFGKIFSEPAIRQDFLRTLGLGTCLVLRGRSFLKGGRKERTYVLPPGYFLSALDRQALGQCLDKL